MHRLVAIIGVVMLALSFVSGPAFAQETPTAENIIFPDADGEAPGELTSRIIQLFLLITILSLAPGIAMMVTCLPFMLIVFSILRQGIGLQQAPPNMLIVSVALFLTYFVMEPVFTEAWTNGVAPLINGTLNQQEAFTATMQPFRVFMDARVAPEALVILNDAMAREAAGDISEPSLSLLVPAFILSEIQRAFEIGFVVLLPFLIIDLVVASILMAMGMMMVPPAIVSLPFKVAFFVLTNGWVAISGALVRGYAT